MKKKFIELKRLERLEKSINYLQNYETPKDEIHHVGPNINTKDVLETNLLRELGRINIRRKQIIENLMKLCLFEILLR